MLKPGAHALVFGGTRTFDLISLGLRAAGFQARDTISAEGVLRWMYGSGFPKSLDVSKAIDKAAGCERPRVSGGVGSCNTQSLGKFRPGEAISGEAISGEAIKWSGWGTALKPAWEPVLVYRKPPEGTISANVLKYGTGAINVDACRVATGGEQIHAPQSDPEKRSGVVGRDLGISSASREAFQEAQRASARRTQELGRWPANVVLDEEAAALLDAQSGELTSGVLKAGTKRTQGGGYHGHFPEVATHYDTGGDTGGASRFFYTAKAAKSERNLGGAKNSHLTVKPLDLMRWLCRLITPTGGIVLDPFAGSGSTVVAALREGFRCIGIERQPEYVKIARHRIEEDAPLMRRPRPTLQSPVAETKEPEKTQQQGLFDSLPMKGDRTP